MTKFWLRLAVVLAVLSGMVNVVGGTLPLDDDDCIRLVDAGDNWLVDVDTGQIVRTTRPYEWSATHPQGGSVITIINEDSGGMWSAGQLILKNADREKVIDNQVWAARWSNRGEYIAYVRDDKILILANSEGEILKQVSMLDSTGTIPIFSSDDAYIIIPSSGDASHTYIYSIPDLTLVELEELENFRFHRWSPTGHLFTGMIDKQFVLVSPEMGIVSSKEDTDGSGLYAVWSPNGEHAAISKIKDFNSSGQGEDEYFLDLIDRTGFFKTDVVAPRIFVPPAAINDYRQFFAWDEDNTLLAWRGTPETGYELVRYDPLTEVTEVIVFLESRVVRPLEFLADGQWALAWAEGYDLILIEVDTKQQVRLLNNLLQAPLEDMNYLRILEMPDEGLIVAAVEGQIGWVNLNTDVGDQASFMFLSMLAGWLENRAIIYATLDEDQMWQVVKVDVSTNEQTILYEHLVAADVYQVNPSKILVFWRQADNSAGIDVWESSDAAARQLLFPPSPTLGIDTISANSFLSPDKQQIIVNDYSVNNRRSYWFVLDGSQSTNWPLDDFTGLPGWKSDSSAFALMTPQQSLKLYDLMGELKRTIALPDLQVNRISALIWEKC